MTKTSDATAANELKKLLNIPCKSLFYTGTPAKMIISFFIDPHFIVGEDDSEVNTKRDPFMRQMCGNQFEILNALKQFNEFALISPYDLEFNVLKYGEYEEDLDNFKQSVSKKDLHKKIVKKIDFKADC